MVRVKLLSLAVGVFVGWVSKPSAQDQAISSREYQIKAAFLYNFVKFVEWQAHTADDPVRFCVLGTDPFGAALDSLAGKKLKERSVAIQRFAGPGGGLESCRVLFVSGSENDRLSETLTSLSSSPVLTVGETEEFARAGGIITFKTQENKIRFAINATAAARAGLKISSKLLGLAAGVR